MQEREKFAIVKSIAAIFLIFLCIVAAQWQYQRGVDRHHRNFLIEKNITAPLISIAQAESDLKKNEWRTVSTSGVFDRSQTLLIRNRYFEGKYGFEYLTLFTNSIGQQFWVDRGWIIAGKDALTAPIIPSTPSGVVKLVGRIRLDSSLSRGSLFALPSNGQGVISKWNREKAVSTEAFYLDLLTASKTELNPEVTAQLPELSDGPHMAYALQWIFFAGLVIYGRILIRRSR
jgi:surfeit locus 1 family protein